MRLLTKELLAKIPPVNSQEDTKDPMVVCKFFMPDGSWTWYVIEGSTRERKGCRFGVNCNHRPLTEYDPAADDVLFFGFVIGEFPELGYFTLSELASARGPWGLPIERDLWFEPCRLSVVRKEAANAA